MFQKRLVTMIPARTEDIVFHKLTTLTRASVGQVLLAETVNQVGDSHHQSCLLYTVHTYGGGLA